MPSLLQILRIEHQLQLGALLLGTLKSGLVLVGTRGEFYELVIGVLLLVAAIFNGWAETIRNRSGR